MTQARLDLTIDVFEKKAQQALALPELTAAELVEAILQEFHELEYLSDTPDAYSLYRASDQQLLEPGIQLRHQLPSGKTRLVLVEEEQALPEGTAQPSRSVYLRELNSGRVFKLPWVPAIVGRPDASQPHNDWVAVNLEMYKTGLRVSRRHARITEKNGRFFIESLSRNPTSLETADQQRSALSTTPQEINDGDVVHLDRSNIALKFIVRPAADAAASAAEQGDLE